MASEASMGAQQAFNVSDRLKRLFIRLGILPFLLVIAVIVFSLMSDNFLTGRNLMNVLRQSVYLTIVSLGQMLALADRRLRSLGRHDRRALIGGGRAGDGQQFCDDARSRLAGNPHRLPVGHPGRHGNRRRQRDRRFAVSMYRRS